LPWCHLQILVEETERKYPVLYILHGHSEDNSSWMNLSSIYLLARDLDLFVVMPSAYNLPYENMEGGLKMQTYIAEELPSKMQRLFPVSDRREDTFLMGESMGGYGAWLLGAKYPEKYAKVVPLSGTGPLEKQEDLLRLLEENKDRLPDFCYMCGLQDKSYEKNMNFLKKAEVLLKERLKSECWDGGHDFFFWNEAIPKALDILGFSADEEKRKQI